MLLLNKNQGQVSAQKSEQITIFKMLQPFSSSQPSEVQTNQTKIFNSEKRQLARLVDKWEATTQPDGVGHNFRQRIIFDELHFFHLRLLLIFRRFEFRLG